MVQRQWKRLRADTGGDGAGFDLSGAEAATGSTSGGEAQQSGSLNIAASVAVNWADHAARAIVADGVQISAGNDVEISATNDANYRTRGSGMAVFADQAIGVGVGLLKTASRLKLWLAIMSRLMCLGRVM